MNTQLEAYRTLAAASLEDAHSLPFSAYSDAAIWQLEAQKIFHREWVFVCSKQQLPKAGDFFALRLAGEALVIIHGHDGQLRALSNICRHRGTPLLPEGFGNVEKYVVCPYHGWAYEQSGELKAVPMAGAVQVDKKKHCLPEFLLESWHGLLFVNLSSDASPLMARLEGIDEYIAGFEIDRFVKGQQGNKETWASNWKLAMENAMESYHLFKVHEQTLETTTPTRDAYYIAGNAKWTLTGGKMKSDQSKLLKWLSGDYPEMYNHYVLISLPPSFVGILTYESFDWIQVLPVNERESVIYSGGIAESLKNYDDRYVRELTQAFFAEDKEICERVQTGMESRFSSGGKLVEMERIVVDFHQFLASRLFSFQPDDFYQTEQADLFLIDH